LNYYSHIKKAAFSLFPAFLVFLLFPAFFYLPAGVGIDPSYNTAVHLALKYHLTFGKDFVFTFGPLGILNNRNPIAVAWWVYLLLDAYSLVTLFLVLKAVLKKHFSLFPILFLFLAVLLEMYDFTYARYFLLFLFYLLSFIREPQKRLNLVQVALLSLLSFYYKVNLGVTAITLFALALVYVLLLKKIRVRSFVLILSVYCICLFLSAWILNVNLSGYIAGSFHLIDGYTDAMYLQGDDYQVLSQLASLIVLLMAALFIYLLWNSLYKKELRANLDGIFIYGVLTLVYYALFKSHFIRLDNSHAQYFFKSFSLYAALCWLFSGPAQKKIVAAGSWVVLILCVLSLYTLRGNDAASVVRPDFLPIRVKNIGRYFRELIAYKQDAEPPFLAGSTDPELRRIIGDHTVDVIPWEISKVYYNGLRYDPRPVIQSYSAYDGYLDDLNYRKYMSPDAPDYILFSLNSVDDRYPFFDESKTKLAMLSRYTVDREINGDLLLKKKNPGDLLPFGETTVSGKLGEDIAVVAEHSVALNGATRLAYSKIRVRYSARGRLKRWLYHPPLLRITLTLQDDETVTYRATPAMLEDGVILSHYIRRLEDFQLLMQSDGRLCMPIKKFRIEEEFAGSGFSPDITVQTAYYQFPTKTEPERKADSLGLATLIQGFKGFNWYKPIRTDSVHYIPDSIACWVEELESYSPIIRIKGWAYRSKSLYKDTEPKVVLRSGNAVYELPSETQVRLDVSANRNRTDSTAGFVARVSRSQLPAGKYEVWVVISDTLRNMNWTKYADHILVIP
jgi:hypothetical protein